MGPAAPQTQAYDLRDASDRGLRRMVTTNDTMFGEKVAHGCLFRRAWEEGCLINDEVFQIGLRGSGYSLDPAFAPGTGTVEIGGLTTMQGLEIIRGTAGLNLVGCDLVEVSPPYDMAGNTAVIAANFLFEMLCALPGVQRGL